MTRTPGKKAGGKQAAGTVGVAGELAQSGAWDAAYRHLAAVDDGKTLDGDALEAFASCAYMCGREDAFIDLLSRAFDAFSAADAPMRAARTAFWIGLTLMFRGEMGRGGGWLSRCERLVDDHGSACAESGYILLPQVEGAFAAGDTAAAERLASQALEIGERHGDNDLAELARHLVGRARIAAGAVNEGLACLDETMLAVTERRLAPIVTGLIYCSVIAICQQYQIFRRAREWTLALSDWCDAQPEMVAFTGRCMIHRSEILVLEGRWSEAAEEAGSACRRLMSGASAHQAGPACYQEGEVLRLNGRFDEADERYRAASRLGFDPQPGLALMRLRQGRLTSALSAIRRSLAAAGDAPARLRLLPAAVEIALAAGDPGAAEDYCGELAELVQRHASDAAEAASAEARGDLNVARGDAGDALQDYSRAAELWREMGAPYPTARLRLKIGRACDMLGDRDSARTETEIARDGFRALGAEPDRKTAEAALRRLDPREGALLTPRQSEVLRLVARGLTNREIAARLGISERTVDRHVGDILNRVDAPTRAAAAAFAVASGLIDAERPA